MSAGPTLPVLLAASVTRRSGATGIGAAARFAAQPAPRKMARVEAAAIDWTPGRSFMGRHLVASEKGAHPILEQLRFPLQERRLQEREAPPTGIIARNLYVPSNRESCNRTRGLRDAGFCPKNPLFYGLL